MSLPPLGDWLKNVATVRTGGVLLLAAMMALIWGLPSIIGAIGGTAEQRLLLALVGLGIFAAIILGIFVLLYRKPESLILTESGWLAARNLPIHGSSEAPTTKTLIESLPGETAIQPSTAAELPPKRRRNAGDVG